MPFLKGPPEKPQKQKDVQAAWDQICDIMGKREAPIKPPPRPCLIQSHRKKRT